MKIALLGAESTGKSQLAIELAAHLNAAVHSAQAVSEYLREWCETHSRTPHQEEQEHIAQTQQERIESATGQSRWVFADTTPLMTAVYSEFIFADTSLYETALAYQKSFDLTLLTGLDMPWQADGIQRDGAHVRAPVDALIRDKLQSAGIAFDVIYGTYQQRKKHALQAIARTQDQPFATHLVASQAIDMRASDPNDLRKWRWNCEKCSDPACEHQLFRQLLTDAANV
jgi:nicotinamide riboside kinase